MIRAALLLAVLLFLAAPATAQAPAPAGSPSRPGPRPALDRSREIRLARSGAPEGVSAGARIWVWNGHHYVVGDSGTTGVNCYVGRTWVGSLEPHCFDPEASVTIFPVLRRRIERYAEGRSAEAVDGEIAEGLRRGTFRVPSRPAMSYMMSAAQVLVSEGGVPVGAWRPHLMIYFPDLTAEGTGLPGFVPGVGFVENPGQPWSALIIPLQDFVPAPAP